MNHQRQSYLQASCMNLKISLMKILKKYGPRTVSCSTPKDMLNNLLKLLLAFIIWEVLTNTFEEILLHWKRGNKYLFGNSKF